MPSAAAVYCRISSDPTETRLGVARQEQDCRALAEAKGWPVARVYVDNDVSAATREKRRPAYLELLSDLEDGRVDAVVTWDADRLHRRPIELEEFFEVCDRAGVRHLATVGGDVDLATGDGVLVARIKGAVAAEEVRKVKARTKRKKAELAEAGVPSGGGRRPFGFEADRVTINEEEAAAIRSAAARVIAGEPLQAITRDWNERGPTPVGGGIWRSNALHKFLTAPRTAGLRQHQGVVVGDASWDPILDRKTWERVRAILTDPARRMNANARKYLLSGGLIRCGKCGAGMVGKARAPGQPAYGCFVANHGCGRALILAIPVEELVVEAVMQRLDSPAFAEALTAREPDGDDPAELVGGLEARLAELAETWASGDITRAEWLTARRSIEARLEEVRRQIRAANPSTAADPFVGGGALRAAWPDLSIEKRRAVLAAVIDRIVINPPTMRGRNKFDDERIDVIWRA